MLEVLDCQAHLHAYLGEKIREDERQTVFLRTDASDDNNNVGGGY